ncbi:MAG: alpha/beta fold hydrolase [Spirochaetales bacterium]|nr:alpha/beta fold hydrolase [Spirochaetales bacterium]
MILLRVLMYVGLMICGLIAAYAVCFQEAGFAVLAFDYRHLGESGGEPRQLVWIPYQKEDYAAAVRYLRGLQEIDPAKIALWGTSLSGGHVVVTAAGDEKIACVSAQVPLLDGEAGGMESTVAVMADAGAWDTFEALAPDEFINEACARILIRIDKYKPLKSAWGIEHRSSATPSITSISIWGATSRGQ